MWQEMQTGCVTDIIEGLRRQARAAVQDLIARGLELYEAPGALKLYYRRLWPNEYKVHALLVDY